MNLELKDNEIAFAIEVYMRLKGYDYTDISLSFNNGRVGATVKNIGESNLSTEEVLKAVKGRN